MRNKYNAQRCYSDLCCREFSSKLERERGEQLKCMEMAGEIEYLIYQYEVVLCDIPKHRVKVVIDFAYFDKEHGLVFEDAKGMLAQHSRVKYAWLYKEHKIEVKLYKKGDTMHIPPK